jgi:hypothetical protein
VEGVGDCFRVFFHDYMWLHGKSSLVQLPTHLAPETGRSLGSCHGIVVVTPDPSGGGGVTFKDGVG